MTEPKTYEEWGEEWGEEWDDLGEMGIKALISDKIARSETYNVIELIGRQMGTIMAQGLFEGGYSLPVEFQHEKERDAELSSWEHVFLCYPDRETIPEQYLLMAYNQWQSEYGRRLAWEQKSLWQYFAHWWRRNRRRHDRDKS